MGCGYVGLELCRQLVDDHEVVGVRRSPSGLDRVESTGARAVRTVSVEGLVTAVDHFRGRTDSRDRVVYTSTTGGYGDHGGDRVDESKTVSPRRTAPHRSGDAGYEVAYPTLRAGHRAAVAAYRA